MLYSAKARARGDRDEINLIIGFILMCMLVPFFFTKKRGFFVGGEEMDADGPNRIRNRFLLNTKEATGVFFSPLSRCDI